MTQVGIPNTPTLAIGLDTGRVQVTSDPAAVARARPAVTGDRVRPRDGDGDGDCDGCAVVHGATRRRGAVDPTHAAPAVCDFERCAIAKREETRRSPLISAMAR